jgi:hypothetical protein
MHSLKKLGYREAVALMFAILAFAVVGSTAAAEEVAGPPVESSPGSASPGVALSTCEGGALCVWGGASFTGVEGNEPCREPGFEGTLFAEFNSAKNNCGTSQRIGWQEGGGVNWKACMNPGGERPSPGRFNYRQVIAGSC